LPVHDPFAKENLVPITWRGEVNGHGYEVNGTVEQAWAHLNKRFPEAFPDAKLVERDYGALIAGLDTRGAVVSTNSLLGQVPG